MLQILVNFKNAHIDYKKLEETLRLLYGLRLCKLQKRAHRLQKIRGNIAVDYMA